ncbi:hypothetical protein J4402_05785 [Candidatus Pacearchaeota archaeon]|nr:hypothetical protein [Candidatus Pacearchaeota archaeon]
MLIEIVVLILAIPTGFLLSWLCREELVSGRKWFKALIIFSVVLGIGCWLFGYFSAAWTLAFIAIASMISYWKSFDGKWTKCSVRY